MGWGGGGGVHTCYVDLTGGCRSQGSLSEHLYKAFSLFVVYVVMHACTDV